MEEKSKLNILETLDTFYPIYDGPTVLLTNYAKHLNTTDKCTVLVPKFPNYTDSQPFEVVRCKSIKVADGYRSVMPWLDKKTKKFVKSNKFDIIHSHSPLVMGKASVKMAKRLGIPSVVTLHTKFEMETYRVTKSKLITKIVMAYILGVFNRADYVWTVSNGAAGTLREYGYKGNIVVIRNGTDMKMPSNRDELVEKVNQTYNLSGQKNVFLFVGRIVETKNLSLVLDALKIVKQTIDDFKFLIVGAGSAVEGLKKQTAELGLENNVLFTGKVMDREFLSGIYLRSDLFLFPSTFDTASLVPIEAAAMKLPTLLVEGCQSAETITDNFDGYTAKENPQAWADRIIEIISNQQKLAQTKEQCHKTVYRSWENVASEVAAKYREHITEYNAKKAMKKQKKQVG